MRIMNITPIFANNPLILKSVMRFTDHSMPSNFNWSKIGFAKPYHGLDVTVAVSESSYAVLTFKLDESVDLSRAHIEIFNIQQTSTLASKPDLLVSQHTIDTNDVGDKHPELAVAVADITGEREAIEYLLDYIKTDESLIEVIDYKTVDFKRAKGTPHNSFIGTVCSDGTPATDYIDNKCNTPLIKQYAIISKVLAIVNNTSAGYKLTVKSNEKSVNRYLLLNEGVLVSEYSMKELIDYSDVLKDIIKHIQKAQESCLKDNERCVTLDWIAGDYRTDYQPRKYSIDVGFDVLAGSMVVGIPDGINLRKTSNIYLNDYVNTRVQDSQPIFSKDGERLYITNDKDSHHPVLVSRDFKTTIPLKVMPKTEMVLTDYY